MGKGSDKDWPVEDGHPSEDELLLYVDGELEAKEAGYVRAHLEACWSCRVRMEMVQETISSFINYRNQVLKPLIEPPPHGWRGFDRKLDQLAAESGKRPPFFNVLGSLKRYFSFHSLFDMPRPMMRVPAGLLIAIIVVALAIRFKQEPIVSASELLRHATEAQATQIRATAQPVVYQKLRVRRRIDQASSREETVNIEVWNDTTNSRFRQSLTDGGARQFIPAAADSLTRKTDQREGASVPPVLAELEQVLKANHLDPQRPLSPVSYQAWCNSVAQKNDEVTRTQLPGGIEALTLRTVPAGQVGVGQIAEAALIVRAKDWHPVEQRLRVRGDEGDRVYELSETAFEVVSLTALSPEIFSEPKQVAASPTPRVIPTATPTPLLAANLQPSPLMLAPPVRPVATADLEVEVLRLLNQAGADLGEQVSATRGGDGMLQVTGIVETEQRKAEILRALEPVMNNPAVQVKIQTVAEAVAQQQRGQTGATPQPSTKQKVEIASDATAAELELRSYFQTDEQARQFAAQTVAESRQAMSLIYALKRLLGQFTPEQLRTLSPEARNKWLALIRSHARAYQNESEALRRELQPIFFPSAPGGAAQGGPEISDSAGLLSAVKQLVEVASANDRVIRSAFATSTENVTTTAIKTPQFWQSMKNAESLAARIQSAK